MKRAEDKKLPFICILIPSRQSLKMLLREKVTEK